MKRGELIAGKIEKIKKELMTIGEMHPGSLSQQYNVCGVKNCQCKDEINPKKHGPYYQLSYTMRGRSSTRFIRKEALADCKRQIKNYERFKQLTTEWKELAAEHAKLKFELAKLAGK